MSFVMQRQSEYHLVWVEVRQSGAYGLAPDTMLPAHMSGALPSR
jgi:hypothetical protein